MMSEILKSMGLDPSKLKSGQRIIITVHEDTIEVAYDPPILSLNIEWGAESQGFNARPV